MRAKSQVNAEHISVLRQLAHRVSQALGETLVKRLVVRPVVRRAIGAVDAEDVDVRREVQLLAAQLAHADDGVRGLGTVLRSRYSVPLRQRIARYLQRDFERGVRDVRHLASDIVDKGAPDQITHADP